MSIDAHAYVLSDGVVTDLGVVPGGYTGQATDINERGDVIGSGLVEQDDKIVRRSALWSDGRVVDLGFLEEESPTSALALNNVRQVVGWAGRAFLWQHGEIYDLNDLLVIPHTGTVTSAWDINEAGQIVANSGNAVVLTPIGRPFTDLDIDCRTGIHELLILLGDWNEADSPADFDGDGIVGFADLLLLLHHWG